MGIFGKRKLAYDGPASPPLAFGNAQPIVPMGQMPDIQTPQLPQKKQGFFGQGGFGRYLAGSLGDALARNAGLGTPFMDAMQQRQQQQYEDELYQRRSAQEWAKFVREHEYERENPKPQQPPAIAGEVAWFTGLSPEEQKRVVKYMDYKNPVSVSGPAGTFNIPRAMPDMGGGTPIGTVEDGHVFIGGDDTKEENWPFVGGAGPQAPRPFP